MYNKVKLIGTLKKFYPQDNIADVEVKRLSGVVDTIKVIYEQDPVELIKLFDKDILVEGIIYTKNIVVNERTHLNIFVKGTIMLWKNFSEEPYTGDTNEVEIKGYIVKPPTIRQTPLGKTITELCVAVNDNNHESYYIPVITFGGLAERCYKYQVSNYVKIIGRLQSRQYEKQTLRGPVIKTAYEVVARNSYIQTEVLDNEEA